MINKQQYLNEVKAVSIQPGTSFTLNGEIGKFKTGEIVTVDKVKLSGSDIELHLSNEYGETDVFYLDKDDDFEELT